MILGLHVSASGGVEKAPDRASKQTGESLQIFAGSPRMWRKTTYTTQQGHAYKQAAKNASVQETFIHVMYLTSYGTADEEHRAKSIDAYINALKNCDTIGARGAVTHLGSHKGDGFEVALPRIKDALEQVIDSDTEAEIILENSAGAGDTIGSSFEEIAAIIDACDNHERLKVCLDTAHMFTAGYDIRQAGQWEQVMNKFDKTIGIERLSVLHINDSKVDFDTHKDRHENIGDGFIGLDAFSPIVNDERLQHISGILEVPGLSTEGPDKANLDRLRKLIK